MHGTTAVVSLFNPSESVLANAAALLSQANRVVVVDDGSSQETSQILKQLAAMGCHVVRLEQNSGIATALNTGITVALGDIPKPDYVLTMDQDSLLDEGYVNALETAAAAAKAAGVPVGMVGPGSIRGLPVRRGGMMHGIQLGGEPIQSGLLLPVPVLERLGTLQDGLFIDGVDTEFYLRCRSHGLQTVLAPEAALDHSLGSRVAAEAFGRPIAFGARELRVRTAAPWRYYYIFRNRLLLARQYGLRMPGWALAGFLADYRHLIIVTLLAPGRAARLGAALSGIADGLAGRTGKRRPGRKAEGRS